MLAAIRVRMRVAPDRGMLSAATAQLLDAGSTDSVHQRAVTAWFQRAPQRPYMESLIQAFEDTFAALWRRSYLTLGEVTLTSIVESVLLAATEKYPSLVSLEITGTGLHCEELRSQAGLGQDTVSAGIELVLVEFLTVLGNLTAEILTPALHAELSRVSSQAMPRTKLQSRS
jgi:hypothetical protein